MTVEPSADRRRAAMRFVVMMGVVAMFGDMTYEGARGVGGAWLGLLGASAAAVGFAAGLGEFIGYGLRYVTGWLGDKTGAYWPLVILGYGINLVAVPGLAFVGSWEAAVALVLLERLGKAIRSPSRSALVSYAAAEVGEGKAFGIEEALDQIGAVVGPLLVGAAMFLKADAPLELRYRSAYLVLLVPVLLNLTVLLSARTRFPKPQSLDGSAERPAALYGRTFWVYVAGVSLLGVGFADWALVAFHLERTQLVSGAWVAVVYAGAMGADAAAALIFGNLFDRRGIWALVLSTLASALFAPLIFLDMGLSAALAGGLLWSIGLGAQESIFKAGIAKLTPKVGRARAYGAFYAVFGLCWWLGSWAMGLLYGRSPLAMVCFSVGAQVLALPLLVWVARATAPKR